MRIVAPLVTVEMDSDVDGRGASDDMIDSLFCSAIFSTASFFGRYTRIVVVLVQRMSFTSPSLEAAIFVFLSLK